MKLSCQVCLRQRSGNFLVFLSASDCYLGQGVNRLAKSFDL